MSLTKETSATKRTQIRTVLVVEDNPDQLALIQLAFAKTFPQTRLVQALSGPPALDCLKQCLEQGLCMPELILLDLYLPGREDGWRVLDAIREMPAPVHTLPVVMFSHSSDPLDITTSYERKATSYIVKPGAVEDWLELFQSFKEYWDGTVSLPRQR